MPNIKAAIANIINPLTFFEIYRLPKNYYFSKKDFQYFSILITKNPGNVFVYPYDTYILNISNQTYNTLPLQFYDYSDSLVEQKAVDRLKDNPPKYIILGVDTKGAIMLDNIPNFSRNPIIAKWMIIHYSVYQKTKNYLILQFNPNKKNVSAKKSCSVFDINTEKIMQGNIIENIFKPSTYYLNNTNFRLPYKPNTNNVFFVKSYNNSSELTSVFNSRIDFAHFNTEDTNTFFILKKYSLPKIRKIYSIIQVNCYN